MRDSTRASVLVCLLWLAACGADGGDPCKVNGDCPGGLCLTEAAGFPGGACSASCEGTSCAAGLGCRAVAGRAVCLPRCGAGAACRAGYQCVQGLCQPPCRGDDECGPGGLCQAAACTTRPGAPVGADCGADDECSSAACVEGSCAQLCQRDGDCAAERTCALDRGAQVLRAYCVDRRGGAPPIDGCTSDGDCDRGSCLMGACLQLCQTPPDCEDGPATRSCTGLPAPLRRVPQASWPELRTCLPRNQTFVVSSRSPLLVPRTARSVLIFTYAANYTESTFVGLSTLLDPSGTQLYRVPTDQMTYNANIIRGALAAGSSSMLLSSSPLRAPLRFGAYSFQSVAQPQAGGPSRADVRAYYQLYDDAIEAGRVPLRVHITDMSGLPAGCAFRTLTAATAPAQLSTLMSRVRQIYQQATVGLTLDPITFVDSDAPTSVNTADDASLRAVLRAASKDTSGGLDLVLVRSINPMAVLGIAGGIPASPGVPDSPSTGAAVSAYALCYPQTVGGQDGLGRVVAHELGHTMGLSHNREMDGTSDPLGEGTGPSESYQQRQTNLMFWNADGGGSLLTTEQGTVMRSMPQVSP